MLVEAINEEIKMLLAFKKQVEVLAMKVSEKAELIDMMPVSDPRSQWFNKHQEYVMSKCAFYLCYDCSRPFYGGLIDCERDLSN